MRFIDKVTILCSFLVAAAFFAGAGMQLSYINQQRQDMGLIIEKPEELPPTLAFATIATGAFRGLVVDILWLRAEQMKEQRQFYDAKQLAEWITILQPRFAQVWEFHGWNMAYNISVTIPASQPEERWKWVKNGYELLRDEAISKYKLRNIEIYRELCRIFQHKIGGTSDDANQYYKIQLAADIGYLVYDADNDFFDAMVAAPRNIYEIESDPNFTEFLDAIKTADKVFADEENFVENYSQFLKYPQKYNIALTDVFEQYKGTEVLKKFDAFGKAAILREQWKMDPNFMRELNQTYGPVDLNDPNVHTPLDWRHPDSHAIYWAAKGLQIAAQDESREYDLNETNTDRLLNISLQNLFRYGKMLIFQVIRPVYTEDSEEPVQDRFNQIFLRPDLRMFWPYNQSMLAMIQEYSDKGVPAETIESFQAGHRNMLINAMLMFHQSGHQAYAQRIYNTLKKLYPRDEFNVPMVTYLRQYMLEELVNIGLKSATEQILALLKNSFYLYGIYEDAASAGTEKDAKDIYDYYQAQYSDTPQLMLPEYGRMKAMALFDFMDDQFYPDYFREALLGRIQNEQPELYDRLMEYYMQRQNEESGSSGQ